MSNAPIATDAKIVLREALIVSHKLSFSDQDLEISGNTEILNFEIIGATNNGDSTYTLASGALVTLNTDGTYRGDNCSDGKWQTIYEKKFRPTLG